jgi:hypothetical protein
MVHGYGLVRFTGSSRLRKDLIAQSTEGLLGHRGLGKAFWDPHGLLALPRPLRDFEDLLSLGFGPPFVELATGLDGGHGAGPPRSTQQLLQVLPLHAPIRPNPSPFPCFFKK